MTKELQFGQDGYTEKGSAGHYNTRINLMHQLEAIWGTEAIILFCEMSAMKYRHRLGRKQDESPNMAMKKATWFDRVGEEYRKKLLSGHGVPAMCKVSEEMGPPKSAEE